MSRNVITKQSGLTAKQTRILGILLKTPSVAEAASRAGVTTRTIFRMLNDPTFAEAYREAREKLLGDVLVALESASTQAVATLRDVMSGDGISAAAKVSAARTVLEMALRGREMIEFEERLRALEANSISEVNS